ncbi:uncharacterized protein BDW43DRAFT_310359 [Aspergillus alliaceus]|uniref:uncharacterized protein n=1 Tax=Petromyces alliaceus TaxID=209559 RepID=UPI0012A4E99A|nr:uncharacterized protein BDW43DRAFT_310359 [Aspergillus alliaceus]KAB8234338.1 hypothetical protein BDW43DRAFT_310359 [Aspergillus alliaceus]
MFFFQPHLTDTDTDVMGDLFESKFPGLDQREFIALSNLLSLRNDGLAEPVCSLYDDEDGEPENQNDKKEFLHSLRSEMLTYYCPRLESTYVPNLKSNLKECCRIFHDDEDDNFVPACRHLRARPQLIFSKDLPGRALSFKYCHCYKSLRGTHDEASPRTAPMFTTQHNSSQGTM